MAYHTLNSSLYLSVFCCFICTFVLFKVLSRTRRSNKYNLPPSPPKFPIIGNLHQLGSLPHRSLRSLSRKYGPLMFLKLGQTPTLVVSSADVAKDIVKFHDISFSDRPQTIAPKIFLYGFKDVAFSPHGEEWRQKRKISVLELLSQKRVRSYQFIREEEVSVLVSKIHEACERGVSVNLTQMLLLTSNNIVSRCALGKKYETLDGKTSFDEIGRRVIHQFQEFSFGDFFPSLWWLDYVTGLIPRLKNTFREMDAFFDQVIVQHKTEPKSRDNINDDDVKNFLDILIQLQQDEIIDFELTLDSIKAMLMDMFVGGSDTGATTLEWGMAELMRHPDKMKKVQQEVRGIVGCKSKIEEEDLNEMKYLKCVIKETLRLHPPIPFLIPRQTSCLVKLRGYDIPSRTMVFVNAWAIHRDPFGIGRRGCPGIAFGVASVESVFANLIYWFDWKLPNGAVPSAEQLDMNESYGITLTKKLQLLLQPLPHPSRSFNN